MPVHEMVMAGGAGADIRRHAVAAYPEECCGILLGASVNGVRHVRRAVAAANVAEGRKGDRYEVDPRAILAVEREAEGLAVVGFFHSHPEHPAAASAEDLARAWEVYSYVIVSVKNGVAEEMRAWRRVGDEMVEETIRAEQE